MTDYTELKRLAEAATPGPWVKYISGVMPKNGLSAVALLAPLPDYEDNSAFIAAANPAAVLAMIGQNDYLELELSGVERAKQELAEKLGCADEPRWKWLLSGADDLTRERDKLKAELAHTGHDQDLLRGEYDQLKVEIDKTKSVNFDLYLGRQAAKEEIDRLKAKVGSLSMKLQDVEFHADEVSALSGYRGQRNARIEAELATLQSRIESAIGLLIEANGWVEPKSLADRIKAFLSQAAGEEE